MIEGQVNSPDPAGVATSDDVGAPVSFEEFKLYFSTVERVTDRRLELNRFNYSISVAAFVAIAAVANLAVGAPQIRLVALILILAASALAVLFCMYWVKQIDDAKQLNAAKFRVLSEMATNMTFDSADPGSRARSFRPFDKEWHYLRGALTEAGEAKRLQVLEGSRAEYFVPRGFAALFVVIFLGAFVVGVINFDRVLNESRFELSSVPTPASISTPR